MKNAATEEKYLVLIVHAAVCGAEAVQRLLEEGGE